MIESSPVQIRILVAESFELIRIGLRSLFANHPIIRLIADTHCSEDLCHLATQHKPDIILVDLQLSKDQGIERISQWLQDYTESKVLVLAENDNEQVNLQIFRSGVMGVVNKYHSSELLLKAIYAIHAGQLWFDPHITQLVRKNQFESYTFPGRQTDAESIHPPRLTDNERHIAYLACKGLSAKEIGSQLLVSEKTIRNQLSMIYKKIGVKKQIELCLKAPLYDYFKKP
ncbi:MAG: response regulator transcription factor [Nitrosomonas sp.]|jgi:DNA-binding NarL/FixJ family response regulator|nr:response regulator transcription factor [Nitrosomonas sp.]MBP6368303.1 response regulator transcription factor [Nitrosomonas sp.]